MNKKLHQTQQPITMLKIENILVETKNSKVWHEMQDE